MRVIVCFILFLSSYSLPAQEQSIRKETNRFLSLDVHKARTIKRIKFYEQDQIIFKIKDYHHRFKGTIVSLSDSSLILDSTLILFKDIEKVIVDNNNSVTKVARAFLMTAGGGYIVLDIVNNLISSNAPVVNPRTLVIGAALIVSGQIVKWLSIKHYTINRNNQLKFINDNP